MGENKTRNSVSSLLIIGMFLLASFSVLVSGFENVKATSSWLEESDSDFNQGTLEYTEINGTGTSTVVQLINGSTSRWVNKLPQGNIGVKNNHSLATIFNTDKVLMYGDWDNNTWIYSLSSNSWTKKVHVNNPSYRADLGLAGIYETDKVLLFGGAWNSETWIYDSSSDNWTKKSLTNKPTFRIGHKMSTIWGTDKVLLFGGLNASSMTYYKNTWVYKHNNNTWVNMSPSGNVPSARYYHAMASVYDTDKVVLFGGNIGGINNDNETWVYDYGDNKWTKMSPANKPSIRERHNLATLWDTDKVVLFGGYNSGSYYNDTWVYDLSDDNWTKLTITGEPSKRSTFGMAMVNQTNKIVLFGGRGPTGVYNDTWVLDASIAPTDGTYTSKAYDAGARSAFKTLIWTATTSTNASVKFQLRAANFVSDLNTKTFLGPGGFAATYYASTPATIWPGHNNNKLIQYKAYFHTNNINDTPTLDNVTILYNNLPVATMLNPTNNSNILDNTPKFAWSFADGDSPSQSAFQVVIDDDPRFLSINYDSGQQSTSNTTWQFPNGTGYTSLPNGSWYWKVRTKDSDGDWGGYSYLNMVLIGIVPPSTTINIPGNNSKLKSLSGISGTTSYYNQTQSITKVETCIKRMDGNYWNGSGWNGTQTWLLATGTDSWLYNTASVSWDTATSYRVQSRATDNHSKVETPSFGNVFTIDTTPPTSVVTNPINNSIIEDLYQIVGNASDTGGTGLKSIYITIFDTNTSLYWINGSWNGTKTWLRATGGAQWNYNTTYVSWQYGHKYRVQSRATDLTQNVETPSYGVVFTILINLEPSSIIGYPGNNSVMYYFNQISGNAWAANQDLKISKVEITLKRLSDNKYWDGLDWNSAKTWLLTTGTNNWYYNCNFSFQPGIYSIQSRATDNKSNIETTSSGVIFTVKIYIVSTIKVPVDNSTLSSLNEISGTAWVAYNNSNISKVEIFIKRLSDNKFWTGTGWGNTVTWLLTNGTYVWSYNSSLVTWINNTNYLVRSRATDTLSNVDLQYPINRFTIKFGDGTPTQLPTSTINNVGNNSYRNTLKSITGTAAAPMNANVTKVEVCIKYFSSNLYWTGTGWVSTLTWLLATGTTSWSYNSSAVNWSTNTKYHIRSRATDNKSHVENPKYGNVFTIDNITPTSSISYPTNNSVVKTLTRINGTASDTGGAGLSFVEICIKRISDGKYWDYYYWSSTQKWIYVSSTTSWTFTDFGNITWNPGTYHIQSRARDKASNIETPNYGVVFSIQSNISSTINTPANNSAYNTPITNISGTAIPTTGYNLTKVEITIMRVGDNYYWNGTSWTNLTIPWLLTTGTSPWSYNPSSVTWSSGNKYLIHSRATDNLTTETPRYGNIFTYDTVKPTSSITTPVNNTVLSSLSSILGTAYDSGGAGLKYVEISLYRNSDGKYWNGFTWTSTQTWLRASGKSNWIYYITNLTFSAGKYHVKSRAKDNANNLEIPSYGNIFTITTGSKPSSSITAPSNNAILNSLNKISGTATDNSGTGLKHVEITIQCTNNNQYWSGTGWGTSATWLLASGKTSWSYGTSSVNWYSGSKYLIKSKATDNSNNVETPKTGVVFNIDTSKPISILNFPLNNANLNQLKIIYGNSTDLGGAGVKSVEISIKRLSDNYYWYGTIWNSTEYWLSSTGTSYWWFNATNVSWSTNTKYNIRSRAVDNADNTEVPNSGITFMFDNQAPSKLSISINLGAKTTKTRTVFLTLSATDTGSGVAQMSFSNDNKTWLAWEQFKTNKSYNLTTGDGLKTVYFRVKDKAGNIGGSVSDDITLDTTPPALMSLAIYQVKAYTNSRNVQLILKIKDIMPQKFKIAFSLDNRKWSNWQIVWSTLHQTRGSIYEITVNYTLPEGDGEKTIYFKLQDEAGNIVESGFDTFILDTTPPEQLEILINENALYTNSENVVLSLNAIDTLSNYLTMSFSFDGESWTTMEEFENKKAMSLPIADGDKKIYFRVFDEAGNFAETYDTIILDTTPPHSISLLINDGALNTNSPTVTLKVIALDDLSGLSQLSFSSDGLTWSTWEEFKDSISYPLSPGDGEKTIYVKVMDNAGNIAEVVSASIIYQKDTDSDGIPDEADAFPNDHAASVDSDDDGFPDYWNIGKTQADSTTGLFLDSFPIDQAASVDTDGDKYPDDWNVGKSEDDSTTNLKLDDFPDDPFRHMKSSPEGENFGIFSFMIITVVIILIIIAFLTIYRNKNKRVGQSYQEPYSDDKTLWKLRNEIIHGKGAPDAELSDSEIRERLKKKFRSGEISEYTYLTLKKP